MFYVVQPQLARESARVLDIKAAQGRKELDYSISRHTVEFPFGAARFFDETDPKKLVTKAKAGDRLIIEAACTATVKNRVVHVEAHPMLYQLGAPQFKRIYRHGDTLFTPMYWEAAAALDLMKLPYLLEVYIVNEVIK